MPAAKSSDVDGFLAPLLAQHDAVGALAQLKTLWIGHVRALFQEDEVVPVQPQGGGVRGGGVCARAHIQPDSLRTPDAGDAA